MKSTFAFLLASVLILSGLLHSNDAFAQSERPNIVIILADDLGYGDTSPLNHESKIATPAFERLAREGVVFTDAHSGSAVCTPTRYGLLCGRYCWRTRLKRGVLGGYSLPLIALDQQTIAGQLKAAGYHTCAIGKWHLGLGWQWKDELPLDINNMGIPSNKPGMVDYTKPITDGPLQHGFDQCFLFPASLDMSPYVYIQNDKAALSADKVVDGESFPKFHRAGEAMDGFDVSETLFTLANEACSYIHERSETGEPFFLYFPMTAPHKPVCPVERLVGESGLGPYGDFIMQVDEVVGQITTALDDAGVADNTLFIVTSDNGSFMFTDDTLDTDHVDDEKIQKFKSASHRANGNLRGTKADVWEAGHRVPFYARWPSSMPDELKGTANANAICLTDLLATCCTAAGAEYEAAASPDSFDFSTLLTEPGASSDRPPVIHHSVQGMFAIRQGEWKLVLGNGSGGREQPRGEPFEQPYALFNLSSDTGEQENVIDSNPNVAEELERKLIELAGDDMPEPKVEEPSK